MTEPVPVSPPRRGTVAQVATWRRGVFPGLVATLLAAVVLSASLGAVAIPPGDVVGSVMRKFSLAGGSEGTADAVLWGIRFPRIALGAVAGAALAVSGAVLQSLFRNPLADPQLLGIGPGAAVAAVIGSAAGGPEGALAGGIIGGMVTALGVRRLGRRLGEADPTRLLMGGVALGAVLSAWVAFVVFGSDRTRVPPVEFWLLGSFTGSTWRVVAVAVVAAGAAGAGLWASWRTLDLLVLGRRTAGHLGVDADFATTIVMLATGALVGATVGAAGVVGFVGLLAPHLVKPATGPRHRRLLPAAALAGASLVVVADLIGRTVVSPVELPAGLGTAAIGGPYLLWLLARRGVRSW